ncbi:hypothetical protein DRO69_09845 [Candidatus Bathyarchaeota archaeon]|nr:MAG: hypothetical protein DRO69_09845 [Candidatus Bathyarchaeota archaeon]
MKAEIRLKFPPFFFSMSFGRYRESYGICSIVKDEPSKHHLLLDVDCKSQDFLDYLKENYPNVPKIVYSTKNGYHGIIDLHLSLREVSKHIIRCPFTDINWFALGLKRGYWYLEYKTHPVFLFNIPDLTFMRVERIE